MCLMKVMSQQKSANKVTSGATEAKNYLFGWLFPGVVVPDDLDQNR